METKHTQAEGEQAGTNMNKRSAVEDLLQPLPDDDGSRLGSHRRGTILQATKPTQLLQFNVQQAYQAQKQTYTPLSTQLPSGQSSGKS